MERPVGIVGLGQLGGIFGQGLLALGHPVLPILRGDTAASLVAHDPELVLVAVAEKDLDAVLASLPDALRDRVALLQNELLPPDWRAHRIEHPTVAIVWFEKKRGRGAHVVRTTRVAGPYAELLVRALEAVDMPARRVHDDDVAFELVRKNLYIVGANLAGLAAPGTTGDLCQQHRELATAILDDVLAIESARLGVELPRESLLECVFLDFARDPEHAATGRSAPARLARAIARADHHGLAVPTIRALAAKRP
jgi:ketopantoate reductase